MSKYSREPIDLSGLKTMPIQARGGKVRVEDFARPYRTAPASRPGSDSLPRILAADSFRAVVSAIAEARAREKMILWGLGGHVIKCGLAPVLIDLMQRGYATAFALNGAAAIHDFEIAIAGQTSEDVEAVLPDGRFGAAEETGREMNAALARREDGIGEALGRHLEKIAESEVRGRRACCARLIARATPVTVHVAIGTDTPHTHPAARRRGHRPRHASRFPAALFAGEGTERRRRLSECRLRRGAAGSVSEGCVGGAQSGRIRWRISPP